MSEIMAEARACMAAEFIKRAEQIGCRASLDGALVIWRPLLPVDMVLDAVQLHDEIAAQIEKNRNVNTVDRKVNSNLGG